MPKKDQKKKTEKQRKVYHDCIKQRQSSSSSQAPSSAEAVPCPFPVHQDQPLRACLAAVAAPAMIPCTSADVGLAAVVLAAAAAAAVGNAVDDDAAAADVAVLTVHQIHLLSMHRADCPSYQDLPRSLEKVSLRPFALHGFACAF